MYTFGVEVRQGHLADCELRDHDSTKARGLCGQGGSHRWRADFEGACGYNGTVATCYSLDTLPGGLADSPDLVNGKRTGPKYRREECRLKRLFLWKAVAFRVATSATITTLPLAVKS